MTVPKEEAPANYVPAAAVIRRGQALSGFTGCKGRVYLKNFYRRNNEEMKIMSNDNKELKNEGINKLTEEELEQVNGGIGEAKLRYFCFKYDAR